MDNFARQDHVWPTQTRKGAGQTGERVQRGRVEKVGGGAVFIGVEERRGLGEHSRRPVRELTGKVEFNPARVGDPEGWGLVDADRARAVAGVVAGVVERFMSPAVDLGDWRARRGDVARDFGGVERGSELIRGLGPLPRPWARRNLVHSDPARHGAQTLMVGSGAGVARLYDKAAETGGRAPEGSLRFEAECRSDWLEKYGNIRVLGDVTAESCLRLALDRWTWSAIGSEVTGMGRVYRIVQGSGLTEREKQGLLAFLWAQAAGDHVQTSKEALAKYRRLQRQLGVSLELGDGACEVSSRLDWESGREVLRVG